jgi:hypothetical protein
MKPQRPIRRFDVFAEYRRQEEEARGRPADEAMGYGLWVAKVVASRRSGGPKQPKPAGPSDRGRREAAAPPLVHGKWHALDGEPQTDELFEREIVQRMGEAFYRTVFSPAVGEARAEGRSYESIRDSIRKDWKPA